MSEALDMLNVSFIIFLDLLDMIPLCVFAHILRSSDPGTLCTWKHRLHNAESLLFSNCRVHTGVWSDSQDFSPISAFSKELKTVLAPKA